MSFRIGKIAGVPVTVNWSVLVIFALIAWGLAGVRFPAVYPDRPTWEYVIAGVAAAVVFFGGLLAHEAAHAIVAQRNGLPVDGITLWLFGGVSRLQGEAADPGAELRIAGVGPLVSFILAVIFAAGAAAVAATEGIGLLFGAFTWLGVINLWLAVFNIIPAAPLDGGRVLRAALWRWRGDRGWAAVISARVGRVFGGIVIAFGIWQLFVARTGFGGIWIALIGWFLYTAATAEERQSRAGDGRARAGGVLPDLRVTQVMTSQPVTARADLTVEGFVQTYMYSYQFSSFPLVGQDGRRPVGLVTLKRVRSVEQEQRARTRLGDIACPISEVPVVGPGDSLSDLVSRLDGGADGRALVLADGVLVGIVARSDIARAVERAGPGQRGDRSG
jgi:Zn-dependent protease/predicted transcriptional regulator